MKLGRPKLTGKNLSRTHFHCQVPSYKLTPRGDNFTSHNLTKVKFDDNGQPVNPKSVRIWFYMKLKLSVQNDYF